MCQALYWALHTIRKNSMRYYYLSFTDKETETWILLKFSHLVNDQIEFQNQVSLDCRPMLWPLRYTTSPDPLQYSSTKARNTFSLLSPFYLRKTMKTHLTLLETRSKWDFVLHCGSYRWRVSKRPVSRQSSLTERRLFSVSDRGGRKVTQITQFLI